MKRMRESALANPRSGSRRVAAPVRAEGRRVNVERVLRLWRAVGLNVPRRKRKRRRDEVWSDDFAFDQTADGRPLKVLPVLDESTRECPAMPVGPSMVAATLAASVAARGGPAGLRSDNRPEFIAAAVKGWLAKAGVATLSIEPGSPWQNAPGESLNIRPRDEVLNRDVFGSSREAEVLLEEHRRADNHDRPHSSLGSVAPWVFAAR